MTTIHRTENKDPNNAPETTWCREDRFRTDVPVITAMYLAHEYGAKVFPTHGVIKSAEGPFECNCQPRERNKASRAGHLPEFCSAPGKRPSVRFVEWATDQWFPLHYHWLHHPMDNYAIATGSLSRVWVLDVDGALGMQSLAELERRVGPFGQTWVTISGSTKGGKHFYFLLPEGVEIRNSQGAIAPGIDVRGHHGYVLLPGSLHMSGKRYSWAEGCAPNEVALAEAPPALVELALLACKKTNPEKATPKNSERSTCKRAPRNARVYAEGAKAIGDGEGRGGFNSPINRFAVKYWGAAGKNGNAEELKAALREAIANAPADNHEPWEIQRYLSDQYLDVAIENARRYVMGVKM